MRFQSLLLVLHASLLGPAYSKSTGDTSTSSNSTTTAGFLSNLVSSFTMASSGRPTWHLTCHPPSPMTDVAGVELFIEQCTLVESTITNIMTRLNITEREVRYIDPTLPKRLLLIEACAAALEIEHDCQASPQDKMPCAWLTQLGGEAASLYAKMGGRDTDGHDETDFLAQMDAVEGILKDMDSALSGLQREFLMVLEELTVSGYDGLRPGVLFEKFDRYRELVEQAAGLERSVGCPEYGLAMVCDALGNVRDISKRMFTFGARLEEMLMRAKNVTVKDEL